MSILTSSLLPAPIQQTFSMKLLSVPVPYMIHSIPAEQKYMPAHGGRTLNLGVSKSSLIDSESRRADEAQAAAA